MLGNITLSMSAALTLRSTLSYIYSLLKKPIFNGENEFIPEIAKLYKLERTKFDEIAKEWTKKYACKIKFKYVKPTNIR